MKSKWITFFAAGVLSCLLMTNAYAQRSRRSRLKPVNFTFDIMPMGGMVMPNIDGVTLMNSGLGISEEIDSTDSATASMNMGINIDTPVVLVDVTAGVGAFGNDDLGGALVQGKVGTRFKLGSHHVTLGPHMGLQHFRSLTWKQDADVAIDNATGSFVGVGFSAGGKVCSFFANLDWFEAEAELNTRDGWTVETDSKGDQAAGATEGELDLSGVRLQLGVVLRF